MNDNENSWSDGDDDSSDGARELADALRQNQTLTTLDLGSNQIGDDGPRAPGRRRAHRRGRPPADEVHRRQRWFEAQIRGGERLRFEKEEGELRFDLVTAPICAQCDQQKPAMFVCGHCSQVVYCGQKCADTHWKTHVQ